MIPERICLGLFSIATGISLILLMRGYDNDAFAAILVFCVGLFQLLEFGLWNNLDCDPGGSNNKASRISYGLLWFLPAILCFSGFALAKDVIGEDSGRNFLFGIGFAHLALASALMPILWQDKTTWCSQPGDNWMPEMWYMRNKTPLAPNLMILVGVLSAILLVDPWVLGIGSLVILIGSYLVGRSADRLEKGEWFSVTMLLSNSIGLWALLVQSIRIMVYGAPEHITMPIIQPNTV